MADKVRLPYKKLIERSKDIIVLGSAESLINWDMETMMPPKAIELRSEQLALLSRLHHKMSTSPEIGKLIGIIIKKPRYEKLNEVERRNVELIKENYDEQTKLPAKLVEQIAKQQVIAVNTWKRAKSKKDYSIFKPELEKLVSLNKQAAEILMEVKGAKTPYDALIDIYEPKMTSAAISKIFDELQQGLKKLIAKVTEANNNPDVSKLSLPVPVEKQREISKLLAQVLGYDIVSPMAAGRIDESEHPFTDGYYDDVRTTTHYYPNNVASSIFSVLHETGHALYDQGLPQDWKYRPVGSACSLGVHESQSRFYENIIGRSHEFWASVFPKMKKIAHPCLESLDIDTFVHAINAVKLSKIRIEADEVTYNLHVIIRFQMERDIFSDRISVSELPAVWNQKYDETVGVKIQNDSEGVMQDTHWASGLYGYFPTYTLGNIYTGQMLAAFQKENPEWRSQLSNGSLESIRRWLNSNIYSRGNLYDPAELIKKATGSSLTIKPFLSYLQEKYSKLYGF